MIIGKWFYHKSMGSNPAAPSPCHSQGVLIFIIFINFSFTSAGKRGQKDVAALPIPDYLRVLKRVSSLLFTYITALSKPRWQSSGRLLD